MRKILSLLVVLLTTVASAWADDSNLLPGRFSVSATKQVQFTKGNLYYSSTDSKYHLEAAQNVTYVTLGQSAYDATHVCHFFWSTNTDWQTSDKEPWASAYAYSTQATTDKFFCGEQNMMNVDGTEGLYALTKDEWSYLMGDNATRNGKYAKGVSVTIGEKTVTNCLVIAPDNCLNSYTFDNTKTTYTADEWSTAEAAGLVCLPAAGYRNGSSFVSGGSEGGYWSATPDEGNKGNAYGLYFSDSSVPDCIDVRSNGCSVRLVKTPYLCFTAEEANSSVTFSWASGSAVQKSTDGTTFSDYTAGTPISLNKGDKVYFKGTDVTTDGDHHFTMTGKIAASGDVTSLTNGVGGDVALNNDACYSFMFQGCTSLTIAPEIPSTSLIHSCYFGMFYGCTSLTTAPELPATTLASECYVWMFQGCTSLTTAPELPATTLAHSCYLSMFNGCTSLTTAPALPATTLEKCCYSAMFQGCSKLSKVTVNFTDWKKDLVEYEMHPTENWLKDAGTDASVTSRTFICPESLAIPETRSASDVPEGWNVTHPDYLCFTAEEATDISFNIKGTWTPTATLQYSKDQAAWTDYSFTAGDNHTISLAAGEKVYFKAGKADGTVTSNSTFSKDYEKYITFSSTKKVAASGNIMSLLDASCESKTVPAFAFCALFSGCTSLAAAPALPATELAESCYMGMFYGCTSLAAAPALPATELANACYHSMFAACTSLTTAPALPATTLAASCYYGMFYGCTSLIVNKDVSTTPGI